MPNVLVFSLALGVPLLAAYLLTPPLRSFALAHGFVDRPSPRRLGILKPRLGGVAIAAAFFLGILMTAPWVPQRTPEEWTRVVGIFLGASLVVFIGAWDDRRELPPWPQLAAQVIAALIAMGAGILINQVTNPLGTPFADSLLPIPLWAAWLLTLFWMVGAMNTVNFLDGLDGLAAGIIAIASAILFLHSFALGQYSIALLPLSLLGATLGFLPHNFYPAKITMGTAGAFFLGYALASLSVVGGTKAATLLLVLGVPILDTAWIILQRLMQRRSPFRADRAHLHHRLRDLGLSHGQIVLLLYALCGSFGALALLLSSRLLKLYALGGMALVILGALALIAQRRWESRG